jgi:hypothetical protein
MNYNSKLVCGPSYEDAKPDGTVDYVGLYKLSAKQQKSVLLGATYTYDSCKNQAQSTGKRIFGLSGFDENAQTGYCYIDQSNNLNHAVSNYTGTDIYVGLADGMNYSGSQNVSALYYIHEGNAWQCIDGVNIPIRINNWDDIECMSANGKDCVPGPCQQYLTNPVSPVQPIICNQDKYNDPNHWCGQTRNALRNPPGTFVDPNVYGNAKLPVKPTGFAGLFPVSKKKVPRKSHCCCPPPDPKIWLLRSKLQELLNRKIEYHPDYKILMDEFAIQNDVGQYAICNVLPSGQTRFNVVEDMAAPPVNPARATSVNPPAPAKSTCKTKCRVMCCPAPDPKKYILMSEVRKILAKQKIQDHPDYPALMKTYASVNPYTKKYMACQAKNNS